MGSFSTGIVCASQLISKLQRKQIITVPKKTCQTFWCLKNSLWWVVYWPWLQQDIKAYVCLCDTCQWTLPNMWSSLSQTSSKRVVLIPFWSTLRKQPNLEPISELQQKLQRPIKSLTFTFTMHSSSLANSISTKANQPSFTPVTKCLYKTTDFMMIPQIYGPMQSSDSSTSDLTLFAAGYVVEIDLLIWKSNY